MAESTTPSRPALSDPRNLGFRPGPNGITLPAWLVFQADAFSLRADRDYNHKHFRSATIKSVKRMVFPNTTFGSVWVKTDNPNDVADGVAAFVKYFPDAVLFSPFINRPETAGKMRFDCREITLEAEEQNNIVGEKVVGIVPLYVGETSVLLEEDREAEKEAADRILMAATPEDFARANIDLSLLGTAAAGAGAGSGVGSAVLTSTATSTTTPQTLTPRQNKNRRERARLKRRKAEAKANAENGGGVREEESTTEAVDDEHGTEANRGQSGSAAPPA